MPTGQSEIIKHRFNKEVKIITLKKVRMGKFSRSLSIPLSFFNDMYLMMWDKLEAGTGYRERRTQDGLRAPRTQDELRVPERQAKEGTA